MRKANTPLEYAEWLCETMMHIPPEELPPIGGFHYHQGVFLMGMQKIYELTGNKKYFDYIKAWVDSVVNDDATIKKYLPDTLDDIMPGMLLYKLYDETGDEKYRKLIALLISDIDNMPKNALGGFWHKSIRPNQMWLDGLFMAGPFISTYAKKYGAKQYFDIVNLQINLMWENMRDKDTGLLYHAWDYSRKIEWANHETGCSSQFWGRALGWYVVALMDIYENMPEKYRPEIAEKEKALVDALLKFQLADGTWCQVLDRTDDPENWTELSCSSLFACGIAKAVRMGVLGEEYFKYAERAFDGIAAMLETDEKDNLLIGHICVGTGVGDYQFYLDRPTSTNDLHGTGAFLYMCGEIEKTKKFIAEK